MGTICRVNTFDIAILCFHDVLFVDWAGLVNDPASITFSIVCGDWCRLELRYCYFIIFSGDRQRRGRRTSEPLAPNGGGRQLAFSH